MYSYEDRIRAVRLYLKLGKRVGATIRQLGYPTKNSLKSWHLEYQRCHDLRIGYVRSRPMYSAQQKKVAVDHYLDHGRCAVVPLCRCDLEGVGISESRDPRRLDRRGAPRNRKAHCRQSNWQHSEIGKRIVGRATGSIPKSPAVKQVAVIQLCTREESARLLAQKAGVSRPTLYNWTNQLRGREAPASMKRQKKPAPHSERAELEQQVESLRRDVRQLQLEHDILKKANELIKKGMGITPRLLSNREKTMLVDALKNTYTLSELLAVLGLARSSYFYHRARLLVADKYAGARRVIADIFKVNHRCLAIAGYARHWAGRKSLSRRTWCDV